MTLVAERLLLRLFGFDRERFFEDLICFDFRAILRRIFGPACLKCGL